MLDPNEQFRTNCQSARFITPAFVGMYYRTSGDMTNGFGNLTVSCREYALLRAHQDSVVMLWIKRHTETGPVLEVKTFCHLDGHGSETQIRSTCGDDTNVWVVISRGSNNYVDDSRYKDPEYSPGSFEEADYGSMQETDAKQPTLQSRPQCCSPSDDHIPINEKGTGKTSPPMNTATNMSLDTISQNLLGNWYVTKIAMAEKLMEQFIGD